MKPVLFLSVIFGISAACIITGAQPKLTTGWDIAQKTKRIANELIPNMQDCVVTTWQTNFSETSNWCVELTVSYRSEAGDILKTNLPFRFVGPVTNLTPIIDEVDNYHDKQVIASKTDLAIECTPLAFRVATNFTRGTVKNIQANWDIENVEDLFWFVSMTIDYRNWDGYFSRTNLDLRFWKDGLVHCGSGKRSE